MGGMGRSLLTTVPVLAVIGLVGAAGFLWVKSTSPTVEVVGGFPRALGVSTPMRVRWTNPHGARRVSVLVEQNGARTVAWEKSQPSARFRFSPAAEPPGEAAVVIGRDGLVPGKAVVMVEVESNDLRAQVVRLSQEMPVILEKPSVRADEKTVYLRRGGTGVVTFTAGGGWDEAGVRVGKYSFPSWPLKGQRERRVSLFSIPPDVEEGAEAVLFARNAIGQEATAPFPHSVKPVKFRERTLEIGAGLMDKVLGELDGGSQGEAAERFARINSKMRRANDAELAKLAGKSEGKRLWEGPFVLLPSGKAEAMFADHRTYKYSGKELNREWHLGIDMASVKNAAVPAANTGKVVHAGRMGIYGNCAVIDHGMGVLTVYGHLSGIAVKVGDTVTKGQEIGKSGMTGLAGGDHLHLGVMVGSAFVDPVEWNYVFFMEQLMKTLE